MSGIFAQFPRSWHCKRILWLHPVASVNLLNAHYQRCGGRLQILLIKFRLIFCSAPYPHKHFYNHNEGGRGCIFCFLIRKAEHILCLSSKIENEWNGQIQFWKIFAVPYHLRKEVINLNLYINNIIFLYEILVCILFAQSEKIYFLPFLNGI